MRKRTLLGILAVLALAISMVTLSTGARATAAPEGIAIGHSGLFLDTSGPHKVGHIMVNGKMITTDAYLIRRYDGGNDQTWCIDNTANGQNNGTKEQLWTCNDRNQQYWYYLKSSYGGSLGPWYQFENYGNDKCLDDTNGGGNGTQLQTYTCLQNQNQAWAGVPYNTSGGNIGSAIEGAAGGSSGNGIAVDNANNHLQDGNKIQAWDVLFNASQAWCGDPAYSTC